MKVFHARRIVISCNRISFSHEAILDISKPYYHSSSTKYLTGKSALIQVYVKSKYRESSPFMNLDDRNQPQSISDVDFKWVFIGRACKRNRLFKKWLEGDYCVTSWRIYMEQFIKASLCFPYFCLFLIKSGQFVKMSNIEVYMFGTGSYNFKKHWNAGWIIVYGPDILKLHSHSSLSLFIFIQVL